MDCSKGCAKCEREEKGGVVWLLTPSADKSLKRARYSNGRQTKGMYVAFERAPKRAMTRGVEVASRVERLSLPAVVVSALALDQCSSPNPKRKMQARLEEGVGAKCPCSARCRKGFDGRDNGDRGAEQSLSEMGRMKCM